MKYMKLLTLLPSVLVIGCADLSTQFKAAEEPADGPRARIRIVANALVKAVPGKNCIDYHTPGAGTIFGGIVGSRGYRGRSLNIPNAESFDASSMGEMYASAGKPIALQFLTTPESRYSCGVGVTFTPKVDHDYQVKMILDPSHMECTAEVRSLSDPNEHVDMHPVDSCTKQGNP
ncbi:hypothetical protein [Paludibacterium yongneupense]|uniref:hypothetical protein n=1 Tax=Paludibacterium yongneupense TaxID=400061 RepID=UPI00049221F2|nr:hypothetical protein [Paludibacterium yongneupense]